MENIIYVKLGNENRIIELERERCTIYCFLVKQLEKGVSWWEKYKYFNEFKRVVRQLKEILNSNTNTEMILEPAFLTELDYNEKMKKIFLWLELGETEKEVKEKVLRLFIFELYHQNKFEHLEELVLELPDEDVSFSVLEELIRETIQLLSPTLNYLTIISDKAESYEDLEQHLYEETGLMLQCLEDKKQLEFIGKNKKHHRGSKSLWIDLNVTKVNYRCVPRNCIYFDAYQQKEKARTLAVKRQDVSYFNYVKFLDTIVGNIV